MSVGIHTERLLIRNFNANDWEALFHLTAQYEASEFARYDHAWPTTEGGIKGAVEWFASGDSYLAVCLKPSGALIGFVAMPAEEPKESHQFNIGYIFDADFHGQGYASECCRALLAHAFNNLQAEKFVTGTAADNRASCRLLERLGFVKSAEGMGSLRNDEHGQPISFLGYTYALTKADWEERQ